MDNFYEKISGIFIAGKEIKKGIFYSNQTHYQDILRECVQLYPFLKNTKKWLLIIHKNEKADVLVDESLPLVMTVQPKRQNKSKGDTIAFHKEIRSFHSIVFEPNQKDEISLSNEDIFIGYLSLTNFLIDINGVLYFDFSGKNAWKSIENYFSEIPQKIQNYIFKNAYELCQNYTQYDLDMLRGWFPFQRILGEEFENLYNDIIKSSNEKLNLPYLQIINAFDNQRLNEMLSDWKKVEVLPYKQLEKGIKHYQNQDPFSSIHVLIPYIEGIVRNTLDNRLKSMKQSAIPEKISEDLKGTLHSTEDNTHYINAFKAYLENTWHSTFSNGSSYSMTRNTVSHGINKYEDFTMEKALQLILTIDQLSYIYQTT